MLRLNRSGFAVFGAFFGFVITMAPAAKAEAGHWNVAGCEKGGGNTNNRSWWGHQERVCELRTTYLKLSGQRLELQTQNGGIEASGSERGDVFVEARVEAWAGSVSEAKEILGKVTIETSGDRIHDSGPHAGFLGNSGYSVNYKLRLPRRLSLDLKSSNGGIDIAHVEGEIRFETTNGGVSLEDLAGDVRGETVNGGLDIALTGKQWRGKGLSAETTNGGVSVKVPEGYSAHLEAGTVNGGIEVGFPIRVQGEIKKRLSTDLGGGGATVSATTTNGGVEIGRSGGE